MPISTKDIVTNITSSETISGSTIVVSCQNTGTFNSVEIDQEAAKSYESIENTLTDRIDSIGYYYQIGGLRWITTSNYVGTTTIGTTTTTTTSTTTTTTVIPSPLDWKLIGTSYWTVTNGYEDSIAETISNNSSTPVVDVSTLINANGGLPAFSYDAGGVLLPDSRVFIVPYANPSATYSNISTRIFDPALNDTVPANGSFNSHYGGVLLHNEKVLCIPRLSSYIQTYDPSTDSTTTSSVNLGQSRRYFGGVLLPNGEVCLVPHDINQLTIYNETTDSIRTISLSLSGRYYYAGGVSLSDGRIFFVPYNRTSALIFDPDTNTVSVPNGSFPGNRSHLGGVLLPDGKVFCVPHLSTAARIYDPATDTLTTKAAVFPGNAAFAGGVLMPDGRVLCIPYMSSLAYIYDPISDTNSVSSITFSGNQSHFGGVALADGRSLMIAFSSSNMVAYGDLSVDTFDINVLLSSYYNKL